MGDSFRRQISTWTKRLLYRISWNRGSYDFSQIINLFSFATYIFHLCRATHAHAVTRRMFYHDYSGIHIFSEHPMIDWLIESFYPLMECSIDRLIDWLIDWLSSRVLFEPEWNLSSIRSAGVILVYDLTSPRSCQRLLDWRLELYSHSFEHLDLTSDGQYGHIWRFFQIVYGCFLFYSFSHHIFFHFQIHQTIRSDHQLRRGKREKCPGKKSSLSGGRHEGWPDQRRPSGTPLLDRQNSQREWGARNTFSKSIDGDFYPFTEYVSIRKQKKIKFFPSVPIAARIWVLPLPIWKRSTPFTTRFVHFSILIIRNSVVYMFLPFSGHWNKIFDALHATSRRKDTFTLNLHGSVDWLIDWLSIDWLIVHWSLDWLIDRLTVRSIDWLIVHWLIDWSIDWLIDLFFSAFFPGCKTAELLEIQERWNVIFCVSFSIFSLIFFFWWLSSARY